jgi:peroxiredoxin
MKRYIVLLVVMTLLAGLAGAQSLDQLVARTGFQPVKEGSATRDFDLPGLSGEKLSLAGFKGKLVMLNFWATWCPPCRAEMPSMQKLYTQLKADGFEILAVNLQENAKTVSDHIKKNGFTFPVALDASGSVGGAYGIRAIPTSFLVDRGGKIIGSLVGTREWADPASVEAFMTLLAK